MNLSTRIILFLVLNFGALAIGGFLQGRGPGSEWYQSLDQAPWTPPGWVFGLAWTTIMICLAFYMSYLMEASQATSVVMLFSMQWILNVTWNPVFFRFHQAWAGLVVILLLTLVVGILLFSNLKVMGWKSLLLAPYFIWLLVADSLNGYIAIKN